MDIYLVFDVVSEERPKVGKKLKILKIFNEPHKYAFPHEDNLVDYGGIVQTVDLPDEGDELRTACLTRVSRRHYERLKTKEDFGEYAIEISRSPVSFRDRRVLQTA